MCIRHGVNVLSSCIDDQLQPAELSSKNPFGYNNLLKIVVVRQ